jgi:hypothetical protein
LIDVARVSFGLAQRLVAEDRHDLMRRASGFRQSPALGLAQAVWTAVQRQSCGCNGIPHELAEARYRERLAVGGVEDGHVLSRCS